MFISLTLFYFFNCLKCFELVIIAQGLTRTPPMTRFKLANPAPPKPQHHHHPCIHAPTHARPSLPSTKSPILPQHQHKERDYMKLLLSVTYESSGTPPVRVHLPSPLLLPYRSHRVALSSHTFYRSLREA